MAEPGGAGKDARGAGCWARAAGACTGGVRPRRRAAPLPACAEPEGSGGVAGMVMSALSAPLYAKALID
ncbi:hypothetical protein, partial [Streptomyces sp. NPDC006307]|uniref:hypothetical protein n=1 Tax=Streptomyces sp. NPDC006307 TaxID=3156748 RepID=UPI0033A3E1D2